MYSYEITMLSVTDGDTIKCNIDFGFDVWHFNQILRLYGINSIEKSEVKGEAAKQYLLKLLTENVKSIELQTIKDKKEKFGRYLGKIFVTKNDGSIIYVNKAMVSARFAQPYLVNPNEAKELLSDLIS